MRDSAKRLRRAVPTGLRGLAPSVSEKPLPLSLGSPAALPAASRGRMAPVSQGEFMILIPRADLYVFPLYLGGNTVWWSSDRVTFFALLDAYVAAGGNYIDSVDGDSARGEGHNGGESETVLGQWKAERGNRDQLVIATKVSSKPDRKGLEAANVEAALA